MPDYGWQYWTGANVVVEVEGFPILECVGLRFNEMESKRPIYGYSSRHYDAVATGQVLLEGSLLINYVHHNYLFEAIRMGLEQSNQIASTAPPPVLDSSRELRAQLQNETQSRLLVEQYIQDPAANAEIANAMKDKVYQPISRSNVVTLNPHDVYGGIDIRVTFGNREQYNFNSGITNCLLQNVHILGRGMPIAIDENILVEEYPFFGRRILNLNQPYNIMFGLGGPNSEDADTVSITER